MLHLILMRETCWLLSQDKFVYTSVQDPAEYVAAGYNGSTGVAVWGRSGKHTVSRLHCCFISYTVHCSVINVINALCL